MRKPAKKEPSILWHAIAEMSLYFIVLPATIWLACRFNFSFGYAIAIVLVTMVSFALVMSYVFKRLTTKKNTAIVGDQEKDDGL